MNQKDALAECWALIRKILHDARERELEILEQMWLFDEKSDA